MLLPWRVFDGMKITFSKWSGFDHMMAQVPEEVPARKPFFLGFPLFRVRVLTTLPKS